MKVHVVQNSEDLVMAIFKTRAKAKKFAKDIGKKRWNEKWDITSIKLGRIEDWILVGGEDYRAKQRRKR